MKDERKTKAQLIHEVVAMRQRLMQLEALDTEHQQAKQARAEHVKEMEALRAMTENSADAIVTADVHGQVTYFSPGAEEIMGFRANEMLGQHAQDFYRGGLEEGRAIMRRLRVEGQIRNYETAIRAKDGRWVEVNSSISLLRDASGQIVGSLAVFKDITEHKQAEEALRESEERYRSLALVGSTRFEGLRGRAGPSRPAARGRTWQRGWQGSPPMTRSWLARRPYDAWGMAIGWSVSAANT